MGIYWGEKLGSEDWGAKIRERISWSEDRGEKIGEKISGSEYGGEQRFLAIVI